MNVKFINQKLKLNMWISFQISVHLTRTLTNLIIGVAHNGVSRIGVENQEVLIIGAGAIGLLATAVSKAQNIY